MAQGQTKAKQAIAVEAKEMNTPPATISRGGPPAASDLMKWAGSPFELMRRLSEDVDQLFNQLSGANIMDHTRFMGLPATALAMAIDWIPAVETFTLDGNLVVQTDLPGLAAEDVAVEVTDGRFTRSLALPEGAQVEQIRASFRDGVLEIVVPLAPSAPKQRRTIDVMQSPEGGQNSRQRAKSPSESARSTAEADAVTARSTSTT